MNGPEDTSYALLDSGGQQRLERLGPYRVCRPAPQALWRPHLPESEWNRVDARYLRSSSGGGRWETVRPLPESWPVRLLDLEFTVKLTGFGHIGVFPEQERNWRLMDARIRRAKAGFSVLNLFAYTGAATLVAARAGAEVCHLDAARGIVSWAREMAETNGLADRPVRWMVEDVRKFVLREIRRGRRYRGLVLDPPTYGRGNKGEVWKIEDKLPELLDRCREALHEEPDFVICSTYSPKHTPDVLGNILDDAFGSLPGGRIEAEEMHIEHADGRRAMPNGATARWLAKER